MVKVVSSHFYDLGEIQPNWHSAEFDQSMQASVKYETRISPGGELTVATVGKLVVGRSASSSAEDITGEVNADNLTANLQMAVTQIDGLYRDYREVSPDTALSHALLYRVGKVRSAASILHTMTGNLLPFSPPGTTHRDRFLGDAEAVIVNHRGNPTRIYVGPVPALSGGISKWFATTSEKAPKDRAVLIDRCTVHRASAQLHVGRAPGVFLRDTIRVVTDESEAEEE